MLTAPFGELVTAMVTPFKENGEVNYEKAAELARHLVENGSDALVVAGTTGESPTLTQEEKLELYRTVVSAVKGKAKVVAGTGSNNTAQAVKLTRLAAECGVDGVMLVVPYYNKPSQEGIYQHFATIIAETDLPVMLYNVPGRTVVNMSAETTLRLAELPNVVAIKEASGDLEQMALIRKKAPQDFAVYSGDDCMTLPVLAVGGSGVVSVAAHVAGKDKKKMISAYHAGDTATALQLHLRLLPLFNVMFISPNPCPVKGALNLLGHNLGPVRLPLVELTDSERKEIDNVLTGLGYL
ncbi:4-hydroxy-tetrahydrodipicolinate synthase [Dethiobacter alkaliphilus]|uniref:4-hydroxy-tetrahydrodipicolinate synthase n=1 Tax=Dethiobacter alkaliphilus TaxID=427926 RepID=UPI002226F14D|nr:4-hydroxy-tetrahydrodipicolinate synthase [Dethiobacter alkaliphilus]MCW3490820.1 4-hydroxy-tetrahydrodipicolinate synthase [Dethiobacter alkaliphilus]